MLPPDSKMIPGSQSEILQGVGDALPFVFTLLLSFSMIGLLSYQQGLGFFHSLLFSGALMSAPLQMTLLEVSQHTLSFVMVLISALSINLRFMVFTLSLRGSMKEGVAGYIPSILVMANAAFTLMSLRREQYPLTRRYCNTVSFTLYGTALTGTLVGYFFASVAGKDFAENITIIVAIFIASSLGKMGKDRDQLLAQIVALLSCAVSLWWGGVINLMMVLAITLLISFCYDR
ncbi:AzlC family ABC transporter permease [Brenneria uluponensis]|uniref:AzlC family ABC transporter permease n=1 Tax=Brenneria uluponensis TaxID=3057057 RepID=UPI0028EA24B1|nr:AzlC family ABC transporter permease [Brenneria ulupoensis]